MFYVLCNVNNKNLFNLLPTEFLFLSEYIPRGNVWVPPT